MDLGLSGRVVLITGGSGRLGRALAVTFARERATVAVSYCTRENEARETASEVVAAGGRSAIVHLDLNDLASVSAALNQVQHELGGVDVLVNNGIAWPSRPSGRVSFEMQPLEELQDSLTANLLGVYSLTQGVIKSMRERNWGRIAHISSVLAEDGYPYSTAYTVPKAGLAGLTRTMSRELAGAGILTNLVLVGFMPRPGTPEQMLHLARDSAATGRITEPRDAAAVTAFLCSSANEQITGEAVRVDGHLLTPMPPKPAADDHDR